MGGFVLRIITPTTPGGDPVLVSLIPSGTYIGNALYSDNTIRNEAGAVVADPAGLQPGAAEFNPNARQPNGQPWPVKASDPRDSATAGYGGGPAPGEQPADSIYVPGSMTPEPVYDNPVYGGWGTPIAQDGPPSSIARRDDRWFNLDGTITDAQRSVVGHWTSDRTKAIQDYVATGSSSLIVWDGGQVIAPPTTSGGANTGSNVGTTAVPPSVVVQPVNDSGFEVDATGDPNPNLDPGYTPGGAGGGGSGVATSPSTVPTTSGGASASATGTGGGGGAAPSTTGGAAGLLTAKTFGIPNWALFAAVAVVVMQQKRGR